MTTNTSVREPAYEAICGAQRRDSRPANCTISVMTTGSAVARTSTTPTAGTSVSPTAMSQTKCR
jgi:hypothetical protein